MTAAKYAERKAARKCLGSDGCTRKPRAGRTTCYRCKENRRRATNAYRARRKLQGYCAFGGCKEKPGATMCAKHAPKQNAAERAWQARNLKKIRAGERRRQQKRIAAGYCVYCNQPLFTRRVCKAHHNDDLKRGNDRRRRLGIPVDTKRRCSTCGETGHRATTCREVMPALSIDEYASARPGAGF